ncbi:arylsulfatase [Fundidesulfovibrio agrisoli]|uniref:arylsulfatase n=1 Tax=Fundidesulfovibrio agrisoli TaxID=2922717 RepID=UPI001FACDCC2|nr:arylsulfatase [Fundidesulfovibrio agrisoli]
MHPLVATILALALTVLTAAGTAQAQTITGTPGSPSATRTIDGKSLPPAPLPFGGVIKDNAYQSKPFWQPRVVPPKDAPNVLLIITDDCGFGAPSTFGGVIPTPALDRIANSGLRYTQFHSTALCSPTRAALITGRNHHAVGFGQVSEASTGYPGYDSVIEPDSATIGRILRDNGYATSWFGKDHNTPAYEASQAGPFTRWPIGLGFEYFYGFVGGDTSQWQPNLFRQTTPIYPYVGNPKWNLTTAMADDAIEHMKMLNEVDPSKRFFVKYAPGGTHAPHHAPPEWIEKFKGKFDMGWNKLREQIFANQKKLGVIPKDAELTPWPKDLLADWDTLTPDEKKLFTRQVEVYAAYLAYTDHEIGRVIQAVQDMGKLEDTLIIYISGDNGSSAEGNPNGTPNEVAQFNSVEVPVEAQLKYFYDVWGSDKTYNHMAVGWTWAFDTPYKWTKQVASHFGGTRQGMAISWPKVIKDKGGIRNQFHHVIDIVPTILEVAGIQAPETVDGIKQKPIEGVSLAYTFDKANAKEPSRHKTQYFEIFGNRGIYNDGWYANTTPISPPWKLGATPNPDVEHAYKWELYDLTKDWTQNRDVAAANPEKLKQMQALFMDEAKKYQVLPLDNSLAARMVTPRPSVTAGRNLFTYSGTLTGIPMGDAPSLIAASYTITAEVEVPQGGGEGILATQGGRFAGWGFYLLQGKPVFTWNLVDLERVRWEGKDALTPGKHTLTFDFKYDGLGFATLAFNDMSGLGRSGTGTLKVDGKVVASQKMERTIPVILQWDETFDIGSDTGTPVDDKDYQVPFAFTGKIKKLTVKIDRPKLTPADEKRLMEAQRNNKMSE